MEVKSNFKYIRTAYADVFYFHFFLRNVAKRILNEKTILITRQYIPNHNYQLNMTVNIIKMINFMKHRRNLHVKYFFSDASKLKFFSVGYLHLNAGLGHVQ